MSKLVEKFNQGIDFDKLYRRDVALKFCVLLALKHSVGHENRVTRTKLNIAVQSIWWHKIYEKAPTDRVIRNCIRQLRKEGALILSTGGKAGGYWRASSLEEVKIFIEKEFRSRAFDLLETASKMNNSALRWFGGQMKLLPGQFYCEGCGHPCSFDDAPVANLRRCKTCTNKDKELVLDI